MDIGPILLQIILICLNAVFASAEIAVISMNDTKLEKLAEQGNKKAKRLVDLTSQPARFLATIQVAITLSGFMGSAFAAENFSDKLVSLAINAGINLPENTLDGIAVVIITLILSYITLVFGELVPKRVAMKKAEKIALGVSTPVSFLSKLFAPIVALLTISTNLLLRCFGIDPNSEDDEVTEEEIMMLVETGGKKGVIDEEEQDFIQNVFEFDDLSAEELVTHRTDVSILWRDDDASMWEETIHEKRFTRYLVCGDSEDDVLGVIEARDFFRLKDRTPENLMSVVKPAYFVPKSISADVLFRKMRKENQKFAVVLDEYGGLWGIITLIDLVEQLVGDLGSDGSEQEIIKISDNTWQIYGSASYRDVCEALGIEENDEYSSTTFGGMILEELGSIPEDGTCPELIASGFKIKVNQVLDHRIGLTTVQQIIENAVGEE